MKKLLCLLTIAFCLSLFASEANATETAVLNGTRPQQASTVLHSAKKHRKKHHKKRGSRRHNKNKTKHKRHA